MRKLLFYAVLMTVWLAPHIASAEENTLINIETPAPPSALAPGSVILLPDGAQSVIVERLTNGDLLTDLGLVLSSEGVIREGEFQGQTIRLDPDFTISKTTPAIEGEQATVKLDDQENIVIDESLLEQFALQDKQAEAESGQATTRQAEESQAEARTKGDTVVGSIEDEGLNIAALLPQTGASVEEKTPTVKGEGKTSGTAGQAAKKTAEAGKAASAKASVAQKAQSAASRKDKGATTAEAQQKAQKIEAKATAHKSKSGDPLRIPQEAVQNGDLSFLEGCWQGTRPEYFSKRIIKECFCFGSSGKSGKRRIFDGAQRRCIGATKAKLSGNGVLSVASSGAACNDGERWGGAEMVCRNSGPRTPCSWIFTDANNGRQAYEIPFVRVQSCGR